ncbi:tetratricopeptide repeat protein [Candidatus Nitrospira neomarina]|uniref:Tetratricopeptide repeat protein n=1 Tax=Candidatus Nitrospira neomarina TaxID=3020899 RepID=A0AA96GI65_9BACT|nr:tetratricopeptide repeat protein [Candidatus Nitrospira neomarina]WNM61442.1 tetratricopeptide repeat protein [Candidatus Nitrospira neomarina]
MSIIADTLQRLQTQTKNDGTETAQQAPLVLPPKVRREPGWHHRPSPLKFWLIGIGMTIGLSSLGMGAYWIGLHLDFGMPTEASSLPGQRVALSNSSPLLGTPPDDSGSFEATQLPTAEPEESLPVSAAREPDEASPTSQDGASMEPSSPLKVEHALPIQPVEETPASPAPATRLITPTSEDPHQKTAGTSLSTPRTTTDVAQNQPNTDPKKFATSPPITVLAQSEQRDSTFVEVASVNEAGKPIPLEADLEEEPINLDELTTITSLVSDAPSAPVNTAALTLKNEGVQVNAQNTGPPQRSSANLLHRARELIQNGEYKEAHAMLSPLFHDPPVTWEPWFWMGTAYLGAGQLEQADQYFLSGLARNDKVPQLWIQRALVAEQQGSFQLAVHELRQAEALQPELPHIHLNMGYAYERMGNNRLANQYFGRFLQLTEGQPEFFSTRKKLFARLSSLTKTRGSILDNSPGLRKEQ